MDPFTGVAILPWTHVKEPSRVGLGLGFEGCPSVLHFRHPGPYRLCTRRRTRSSRVDGRDLVPTVHCARGGVCRGPPACQTCQGGAAGTNPWMSTGCRCAGCPRSRIYQGATIRRRLPASRLIYVPCSLFRDLLPLLSSSARGFTSITVALVSLFFFFAP